MKIKATVSRKRSRGTRERILEAAEELFAEEGFDRVSVRHITSAGGVNLAAVNYHFGSREGLIDAVLERYINPINEERLRILDELEAGGALPGLEQLVGAFVRPMVFRDESDEVARKIFFKMLGRCMSERSYRLPAGALELFQQTAVRFSRAFGVNLPGVPVGVIIWRMHFMVGAIIHSLLHAETLNHISGGLSGREDADNIYRRLVDYFVAGMRAEVRSEKEEK